MGEVTPEFCATYLRKALHHGTSVFVDVVASRSLGPDTIQFSCIYYGERSVVGHAVAYATADPDYRRTKFLSMFQEASTRAVLEFLVNQFPRAKDVCN